MATPILATKLHIPSPRPFLIARSRLIEQLNQGGNTRLTIISAPAGYGKSTLFSEWAHRTELPVALLSLDPNDNNLKRFVTYVVAAFQTIVTGFGELTQSLLETHQPLPADILFTSLINDLNTYGEQVVLALGAGIQCHCSLRGHLPPQHGWPHRHCPTALGRPRHP